MKNLLKRNVKQRIIKTDGYGRWLQKRSDGYGTGNGSFPHGRRIKKKYDFLLALEMEADEYDVEYSSDMENSIKKIINNVKILLAQVKGR